MSQSAPAQPAQRPEPVRPYGNVTLRLRPAPNTGQLEKIAEVVLAARTERRAS